MGTLISSQESLDIWNDSDSNSTILGEQMGTITETEK